MSNLAARILLLVAGGLCLPALGATLYKCDGPGGSTAYTGSKEGYSGCKVVHYATPSHRQPVPGSVADSKSWDYRENTGKTDTAPNAETDSSPPAAPHAASATAAQVRARGFGVVSTAPLVRSPESVAVAAPDQRSEPATKTPAGKPGAKPAPRVMQGAVYAVKRKDGITEYTNIKPGGGEFTRLFTYIATCVACDVRSSIDFARTALNLDAYREVVSSVAAEFGVDTALLRAVIHAESAFNPNALSIKGAQGLMQLMPGTATELGVVDAFDVAENIRGGARYLAGLLQTFGGDERLATAAYNAGPGAVRRHGGVPPYDETQVYVQRVATLRDRYRQAL